MVGLAEDLVDELLEHPLHLQGHFQKQKQALDRWDKSAAAQAKIVNNEHEKSVHTVAFWRQTSPLDILCTSHHCFSNNKIRPKGVSRDI